MNFEITEFNGILVFKKKVCLKIFIKIHFQKIANCFRICQKNWSKNFKKSLHFLSKNFRLQFFHLQFFCLHF